MKTALKQCILSLSVYRQGDSPVFGDSVTKVSLEDEGAGLFLVLEQQTGRVRFDFDEFEVVVAAVKNLKQVAKGVENE